MTFIKTLKLKRLHLALCVHKREGGSIRPCRAQEEAGGLPRHQQREAPKNYPQLLLHRVQGGKAKLCKMLKVLEV